MRDMRRVQARGVTAAPTEATPALRGALGHYPSSYPVLPNSSAAMRNGFARSGAVEPAPPAQAASAPASGAAATRQTSPAPFQSAHAARQVTRMISSARSWRELAEVLNAQGGAWGLNDIQLGAALSRLAKVDLAADKAPARLPPAGLPTRGQQPYGAALPFAGVQQQQPHAPGPIGVAASPQLPQSRHMATGAWDPHQRGGNFSLGSGPMPSAPLPPGSTALGRVAPGLAPPPPPPPAQLMQLTPLSRTGPVRESAQPAHPTSSLAPLQPSGLRTSATPAGGDTGGLSDGVAGSWYGRPPRGSPSGPAASPAELYLVLLEELARRCGPTDVPAPPGGAQKEAVGGRLSGQRSPDGAVRPSARVLANGAWAATRLLLRLGPQLGCGGDGARRSAATGQEGLAAEPGRLSAPPRPETVTSAAAAPAAATGLYDRTCFALRTLLRNAAAAGPALEPQHVSNLLYSVSQLATQAPGMLAEGGDLEEPSGRGAARDAGRTAAGRSEALRLVRALVGVSLPKLPEFGAQALSNSLYAVAVMDLSPPRAWVDAWLAAAAGRLAVSDPQHVSNMLWSLVRIRRHPGDAWLMAAVRAASFKAPAFTTEGLCVTLWSLARLGFTPDQPDKQQALLPLLTALRAAGASGECGGQDVANGMWAVGQLKLLTHPAASPTGMQPSLPQQQQQQRQQLADATAAAGTDTDPAEAEQRQLEEPTSASTPALVALRSTGSALLSASARHLHRYTPQQLANTAWAAAALELPPPPGWQAQFWPAALAALPAMRTEELVATAMSAARLGLQPPEGWVAQVLDLTRRAMQEQVGGADAREPCDGSEDGGDVVVGEKEEEKEAAEPLQPVALTVTPRLLASLLWCVAAWRVRVPAAWTAQVLGCLEEWSAEGSLEPEALAMALQSMSRMGLRPDGLVAGWTRRVVESLVASLADSDAEAEAGVDEGQQLAWAGKERPRSAASGGLEGPGRGQERGGPGAQGPSHSGAPAGAWAGMGSVGASADGAGDREQGPVEGLMVPTSAQRRAARMLLWSLARLRCPLADDSAGYLALLAADYGSSADDGSASGPKSIPTNPATPASGARAATILARAGAGAGAGQLSAQPPPLQSSAKGQLAASSVGSGRRQADNAESGAAAVGSVVVDIGAGGPTPTTARNVCVALWALSRVSRYPPKATMQELVRRAAAVLPCATASELVAIVGAFAALGFRPGSRFWSALERAVWRLRPEMQPPQVWRLRECCSRLRWQLPVLR